MTKILIIDDNKTVLESLKLTLDGAFDDLEIECVEDFNAGVGRLLSFRPDVVVLDLRDDPSPSKLPGQKTWKVIWESHFCPVAIYTAVEGDLDPPIPAGHPFVKRVTKGRDAEAELVEVIEGFLPGVAAIRSLRSEVDLVIHDVLRVTAGSGVVDTSVPDYLLHAGRRRVAASMDAPTVTSDRKLTSWEQYLLPAIGDSPLTADLLREQGVRIDDPKAYRLILTPSCDLVKDRNELTLVVARCEGTTLLAGKLNLSLNEKRRNKDAGRVMSEALNPGIRDGLLPLPRFPGRLPSMVANMKNLEVISYEAIGGTDPTHPNFDRIASIDSPFREQVAWAFLTTVARPGMPDRDLEPWAMEIVEDAAKAAGPTSSATPG